MVFSNIVRNAVHLLNMYALTMVFSSVAEMRLVHSANALAPIVTILEGIVTDVRAERINADEPMTVIPERSTDRRLMQSANAEFSITVMALKSTVVSVARHGSMRRFCRVMHAGLGVNVVAPGLQGTHSESSTNNTGNIVDMAEKIVTHTFEAGENIAIS